MNIHLIAIGGSIMHNLAIALYKKSYHISGSDDHIYEPAYSRLKSYGLLPEEGWNAERITKNIDLVILGMHAKADNPEVLRAQELNIPVMSFPQFIYEQSVNKLRVVIAGSHGKTSVTAMVMHVLKKVNLDFDYAVGSVIEGFEDSVKLSEKAQFIIIEGDEYLSSALDKQPKFMWYHPDIALINGIAWDHINVFPTYDIYLQQFENFISSMNKESKLLYHEGDVETARVLENVQNKPHILSIPKLQYAIKNNKTIIHLAGKEYTLSVFGTHNIQNIAAAEKICALLDVEKDSFWKAISDFKGAGKRLEEIPNQRGIVAYRDFAHSPSKVKGSVNAVVEQYADKKIIAVLELHTFSSLNKEFIKLYENTLNSVYKGIVYLDFKAISNKGGNMFSEKEIKEAFKNEEILLITDKDQLLQLLKKEVNESKLLLLMSSGNFGGMKIEEIFA